MSAKVNSSKYAVLGMLSLGPCSGYDIKKAIDRSIVHFWSESFGQIYPILRRLETDGLARRRHERQHGKPERQVYSLTPRGRAELERWLHTLARPEGFRSELLLKLFLGAQVPAESSMRQIQEFRQRQQALLSTYATIEAELRAKAAGEPNAAYWLITLRFGLRRASALALWAEESLRELARRQRSRRPRRRGA